MKRRDIYYWKCDRPAAFHSTQVRAEPDGRIGASLNKPIVRKNGESILPVSLWERWHINKPFADCCRELDAVRGANVIVSDDEGGHWRYRGGINVNVGRLLSAGASLKNIVKSKLGMNHGGAGDKPSAAERK